MYIIIIIPHDCYNSLPFYIFSFRHTSLRAGSSISCDTLTLLMFQVISLLCRRQYFALIRFRADSFSNVSIVYLYVTYCQPFNV